MDRVKGPLADFIRLVMRGVDYLALYPAAVVVQRGDGTLDVRPDSSRLGGLEAVPLRLGVPGVAVKVAPGARVLLGFEGGDPTRPVATLWESSGLLELQLGVGATDAAVLGTTYQAALNTFLTALNAYATAIKSVADPSSAATPPLLAAIASLQAVPYLSTLVKVKATP